MRKYSFKRQGAEGKFRIVEATSWCIKDGFVQFVEEHWGIEPKLVLAFPATELLQLEEVTK